MQLVVLGLNHKSAPVEVREKFSLSDEEVYLALASTFSYESIKEMVILSTCNRTEIYAVLDNVRHAEKFLKGFVYDIAGYQEDNKDYFYFYDGSECIRHLYKVAASLDSLVLGEGQILSQVKKAYSIAREAQTTSTVLNILFHRAITIGKRVRTETLIAHNTVSVSSAAVGLAGKLFTDFSKCKVLLVGAGKMGVLTALNLKSSGCNDIYIANRDSERAAELAQRVNGKTVLLENVVDSICDMDVIITSTGATHYIIEKRALRNVMEQCKNKKIILIDIAVPRDIDPAVENLPGVELYNIDDLQQVVSENRKLREQEAQIAQQIIKKETKALIERYNYLSLQPVMQLMSDKAEKMRRREVKRALAKLPDLTDEEQKVLDNMSQTIVRKLLRDPMIQLNKVAGTQNEDYYIKAMRKLFKLDLITESDDEEDVDYRDSQQQTGSMASQSYQS